MRKKIMKKTTQKITAIIIIMIICNFIMSTKVFANTWMSIHEYLNKNYGAMDYHQDIYDVETSPAIKKVRDAFGVSSEEAIEILKNHEYDSNALEVATEMQDTGGTTYKIQTVSIKPTPEEKERYNITVDSDGNATVDTSADGSGGNTYREGADEGDGFGVLFGPLASLLQGIGDSANRILQRFIIADNSPIFYNHGWFQNDKIQAIVAANPVDSNLETVEVVKNYIDGTFTGHYGIPDIKLTPAEIFAGNVSALDANFFKTRDDHKNELGGYGKSIVEELRDTVSTWYVALRNIAIVGLLSALLYIGIRIIISSSVPDKAKYKQFFVDWVVALCLIFFLHYIMAFTMTMSETVTDVLAGNITNQGRIKEVNIKLINEDGSTYNENGNIEFSSNFTGLARIKGDYDGSTYKMGYTVLYLALTMYTVYFTFVYLKRLLMLAFFTMIAPLVALTYPLDKIKDGKAQAFDYWFKEYMFYALLQPLHMLLYTVFVSSALKVAANNILYAIVAMAFIVPAEKIVKEMFGIKGHTESAIGGFAGGALASQAFNALKKGPPWGKKDGNGGKNGENGDVRFASNHAAPSVDNFAQDASAIPVVLPPRQENNEQDDDENQNQPENGTDQNVTPPASNQENPNDGAHPGNGVDDGAGAMNEGGEGGPIDDGNLNGNPPEGLPADNQPPANGNEPPANGNEDPFAAIRRETHELGNRFAQTRRRIRNNLGTAAHMRWTAAGGGRGIALKAARMAARGYGRTFTTLGMAAVGGAMGMVGGKESDIITGTMAGLTAGTATSNRLGRAIENAGGTAVGSFASDVIHGVGDEADRERHMRSYVRSANNRNRIMRAHPEFDAAALNDRLTREATMAYDAGITDTAEIGRATDMEETFNTQNGATEEARTRNHDMIAYLARRGRNYTRDTYDDPQRYNTALGHNQQAVAQSMRRNIDSEEGAGRITAQEAERRRQNVDAQSEREARTMMDTISQIKGFN